MELGALDQRRDAAAVVARDGIARVPDQEGKMEALKNLTRHNSGVAPVFRRLVRKRRALRRLRAGVAVGLGGCLRRAAEVDGRVFGFKTLV